MDYSVQNLLEGSMARKFQDDFTKELTRVCAAKSITIHSAFIRRIDIPDQCPSRSATSRSRPRPS